MTESGEHLETADLQRLASTPRWCWRPRTAGTGAANTLAVRNWTDAVQSFTGNQPRLPDAQTVVGTYFDLAEKALAKQRELAQQAVAASVKATKAVSDQAAKVTAQA